MKTKPLLLTLFLIGCSANPLQLPGTDHPTASCPTPTPSPAPTYFSSSCQWSFTGDVSASGTGCTVYKVDETVPTLKLQVTPTTKDVIDIDFPGEYAPDGGTLVPAVALDGAAPSCPATWGVIFVEVSAINWQAQLDYTKCEPSFAGTIKGAL